ncbi:MAG: glutamyl-tRNA reductase, partial [bacterium]
MILVALGASHRTAELAVRERLAFSKAEVPDAVRALRRLRGVREAVLLSTCNRVECFVACDEAVRLKPALVRFLQRLRGLPAAAFERALVQREGLEMVRHVIEVAAGLDSQVVGEAQILAQVRDAHAEALRAAATGTVLNGVFNRALAAAKRVRTETEIGRLPASVASVAVDLAEKIFGGFAGRT